MSDKKDIFTYITPEEAGVSSELVLDFIKTLDERRMHTHSIIMAKGEGIFAECHYKPFNKDFLHRMYSVSKSFTGIATGLAITNGLFKLDDVITDYLPEYKNENFDEYYGKCTIRDMLMMRSNIGTGVNWWGKFDDRVKAYYTQTSDKVPGGLYKYDSIGSFLLGCIIEKLTGKTFLEYLKENCLYDLGFSKESYVLREPGGYAIGDSGVMCTAKDLLIFARFIMRGGEWGGKQYIDRTFMEDAIKKLSHNDFTGTHSLYSTQGYGYLIWKTHPDGFTLTGMGDQLAICDMKNDICFVITSDNQAEKTERHVLFHEYYKHFLPKVEGKPLRKKRKVALALREYLSTRELVAQYGEADSRISGEVIGAKYNKVKGHLPFDSFTLNKDSLNIGMDGKELTLEFGILKNKETKYSFGTRARADMMGVYEEGMYDANSSAGWVDKDTFAILLQVTDTFFGCLAIHIAFTGDEATMLVKRSGQYVFEGIDGYMIFKKEV